MFYSIATLMKNKDYKELWMFVCHIARNKCEWDCEPYQIHWPLLVAIQEQFLNRQDNEVVRTSTQVTFYRWKTSISLLLRLPYFSNRLTMKLKYQRRISEKYLCALNIINAFLPVEFKDTGKKVLFDKLRKRTRLTQNEPLESNPLDFKI